MLTEYFTPERIEQIKGAAVTLAGFGGLDIITGAWSNKVIRRVSIILDVAERFLMSMSVLAAGIANVIGSIQAYGDDRGKVDP